MRIYLILMIAITLVSCTSIELAKEVTKATSSIKNSVDNVINSFEKNKELLEVEKKKEKKLVSKQKQIIQIDFLGISLKKAELSLGKPSLVRIDSNTVMSRFDINKCKFFLFSSSTDKNAYVEYFEIRDVLGNLIIEKNKVEECYTAIKLS